MLWSTLRIRIPVRKLCILCGSSPHPHILQSSEGSTRHANRSCIGRCHLCVSPSSMSNSFSDRPHSTYESKMVSQPDFPRVVLATKTPLYHASKFIRRGCRQDCWINSVSNPVSAVTLDRRCKIQLRVKCALSARRGADHWKHGLAHQRETRAYDSTESRRPLLPAMCRKQTLCVPYVWGSYDPIDKCCSCFE